MKKGIWIRNKIPPAQPMREGGASFRFALRQAKADRNGVVDLIHHGRIEPAHVLAQAALVNGADGSSIIRSFAF